MSRPEILQHDLQDHHPTLSQRTPDLPSDHVIQLEFDIEEDIPGELEDFVLQSRLGAFRTAQELFEANLKPHLRFFPVVAEYADFLLEQQSFRQLLDFVLRLPPDADSSEDERGLLDLLFALSTLRTEGSLNKALSLARNWRSRTARPWKHFSEADVRSRNDENARHSLSLDPSARDISSDYCLRVFKFGPCHSSGFSASLGQRRSVTRSMGRVP